MSVRLRFVDENGEDLPGLSAGTLKNGITSLGSVWLRNDGAHSTTHYGYSSTIKVGLIGGNRVFSPALNADGAEISADCFVEINDRSSENGFVPVGALPDNGLEIASLLMPGYMVQLDLQLNIPNGAITSGNFFFYLSALYDPVGVRMN